MIKKNAVLFPIAIKLITIITAIILITLITTTILITNIIRSDVRITAENNNFALNQHSASEAEIFINSIMTNTAFILNLLGTEEGELSDSTISAIFDTNRTIAAIFVPGHLELINQNYFYSLGIDSFDISAFIKKEKQAFERAESGETVIGNASVFFKTQLLAVFMPVQYKNETTAVLTLFSPESLTDTFGSGTNKATLVNSRGDVLVSGDIQSMIDGKSIADTGVFSIITSTNDRQRQLVYHDTDGSDYFTSFYKLLGGEAIVMTQIQDSIVFEALQIATRRNFWLELTVLFTAVLFVWFFSKTISVPVQELGSAVKQIEQGNFTVSILSRTHDELALLADSIIHMGQGLAERERLKETFCKFINIELAERAMKGELKLGGENRQVTIFFTDIRSFTSFSEKMTPQEVVTFLNGYLEIMVECVTKTGGSVDKFIGDAIMAVWGAPIAGKAPESDALSAVISALLMRHALADYNKTAEAFERMPIQIGCGINSGSVIAGQIGSHERMEYTVIGDTVNLASRIESINKPLATDILISEQTYNLIQDSIIVEEMPSFKVKGKHKPVRLFAVVALRDTAGTPLEGYRQCASLAEVRNLLGKQEPDLTRVDINAEEEKYKVQD